MKSMPENFVSLMFLHDEIITESKINAEYEKGNYYIYIELKADRFSPEIYLPSSDELDPIRGSIIEIVNESHSISHVHVNLGTAIGEFIIKEGMTFISMGTPGTGWLITAHD